MAKFRKYLREHDPAWQNWKYSVLIKVPMVKKNVERCEKLSAEINILQATVIQRDIEQVNFITRLAMEKGKPNLEDLLKEKMKCNIPDALEDWQLSPQCSWILDASVIHLAAFWHVESLSHFLNVCPSLRNIKTDTSNFTPLHVAASCDDETIATSLLIQKEVDVQATNGIDQTALHIAAHCGFVNTVITLLFEGNADVMALDHENQTSIHVAKTSKILNILLSKTSADKVNCLYEDLKGNNIANTSEDHTNSDTDCIGNSSEYTCLFDHILQVQPASIQTYLDLMVTELDPEHYIFHLDLFDHGTTKKDNYLDKHQKLIDAGHPEMLLHPVMMFFTNLKWYPHKTWYYINFSIFLVFLVSFTTHCTYCIDFIQCGCKENPKCNEVLADNENITSCRNALGPMHGFTRYFSWSFLWILTGIEILQFVTKLLAAISEKDISEFLEYFSKQNVCEVIMLCLSHVFFFLQYNYLKNGAKPSLIEDFLGWSLFMAWIDLTIFLGRFDVFGKHIYRSWHVMKNVAFSMVVYIPIMMAFACAFHCFLMFNETFEGPISSFLKVLTMVLGEFDYTDNFLFDQVEKVHGSKVSVQLMLIMFIIYGSLIIMNLITAWIVITQRDANETEVILAKQRIEEISGATRMSILAGSCFRKHKRNKSSKLCISRIPTNEKIGTFLTKWHQFKAWLVDDKNTNVWKIQEHIQNGSCQKPTSHVPLYTRALVPLSTRMIEAKRAKQSELIKTIRGIQKQNDRKLNELLANEEKNHLKTCHRCSQPIPAGYNLKYMVLEAPDGKLTRFQPENEQSGNEISVF